MCDLLTYIFLHIMKCSTASEHHPSKFVFRVTLISPGTLLPHFLASTFGLVSQLPGVMEAMRKTNQTSWFQTVNNSFNVKVGIDLESEGTWPPQVV